jgi:hypothetical protein
LAQGAPIYVYETERISKFPDHGSPYLDESGCDEKVKFIPKGADEAEWGVASGKIRNPTFSPVGCQLNAVLLAQIFVISANPIS